MAYDDPYNDPYNTGTDPSNFWGGGPAGIVPNTAPTIDFQGQTDMADPTHPGTYLPPGTSTTAAVSGNAALWAQVGQNPQAFVQALIARDKLAGKQTDPTALNKILAALKDVGVNASLDTRTDQYHKGIMLNGQFVKLLDGNDNWTWQQGNGSAASGAASAPGGVLGDQSLTAPFTEGFQDPYGKPAPFSYDAFQAPTGQDVLNEPGYQFRLGEGLKAINHSAAAQGSLLTGGTFKGLNDYAQNFASGEYQNVFNRALTGWGANRSNAASAYDTNYQSQFVDPYAHNAAEYAQRYNIFKGNQDGAFNKYFQTAQLGANAAGQG